MTITLPTILLGNQENNVEDYWNTCPKVINSSEKLTPKQIQMAVKDREINKQAAVIATLRESIRRANSIITDLSQEKKEIEMIHQKKIDELTFDIFKLKCGEIQEKSREEVEVNLTDSETKMELSNCQDLVLKQEKELRDNKVAINELNDHLEDLKIKNNKLAQMCSSHFRFLEEKKKEIEDIHESYQSSFAENEEYELKLRNQEALLTTLQETLVEKDSEVERLQNMVDAGYHDVRGAEEALLKQIQTASKREEGLMEKIKKLEEMLELEEVQIDNKENIQCDVMWQ